MVELQRLTGMRSGEVVIMRTRHIGMTGKVWVYQPTEHKTAHHGHARIVYLGPRAQAVLRAALDAYLFQPAEAVTDLRRERHARRVTPAGQGNEPGTNQRAEPKRTPKDHYTTDSYRRAIVRACNKADRAARVGRDMADDERLVPRWHPHQLPHNYATNARREYGLEAAQILLGHSSALVTDAVYAERDTAKAMEVVKAIG